MDVIMETQEVLSVSSHGDKETPETGTNEVGRSERSGMSYCSEKTR